MVLSRDKGSNQLSSLLLMLLIRVNQRMAIAAAVSRRAAKVTRDIWRQLGNNGNLATSIPTDDLSVTGLLSTADPCALAHPCRTPKFNSIPSARHPPKLDEFSQRSACPPSGCDHR